MAFESVNDYINSLDENGKKSVTEFISFMNKEFPEITPKISFSMPMWWAGPKMYDGYVAISPAKKHFSIHFHEENYLLKLQKELPDCNFGKKCVNIRYDDEQSFQIVRQNVKEYFNSIL
jgi:uncharacterized protein YdhG (YjbR/CyaY superfamily)